jgi:hypothetical protein
MNLSFTGTGNFREAQGEVSAFRTALDKEMTGVAQSFAQATGASSAFTSSLAPVGFGLTTLAGVAITAGGAVFGLAQKTATTEVKLWDLSQRTNFAVESLSALKIAIENSGGSLDRFQFGLIFFQKNVEKVAELTAIHKDKNNELAKSFKALGIDVSSNEAALRSAFVALSKITDGTQQAALAQRLFRGSGREVLAIIKESHGDFDAYAARLKQLGIIIGTEAAANADKFRDALHILSLQADAAGRQIGDEVLPEITGAMQDLTSATFNSKSVFKEWGEDLRDATQLARIFLGTLRELSKGDHQREIGATFDEVTRRVVRSDDISSGKLITLDRSEMTPEQQQAAADRSDRELQRAFAAAGLRYPTTSIDPADLAGGKPGGANKADKARKEAIRQLEQDQKKIEEAYRHGTEALKREYDLQLTSSQTFTKKLIDDADERFNKLKASLDKQRALEKDESGREKVDNEIQKAQDERDKTKQKAQDDQDKREIDSLKKHRDALLALGDQYDSQTIDSIRATADMRGMSYEEAENRIYAIQEKAFDRRLQALSDDEAAFYKASKDIGDVNLEVAQQYSDAIATLTAQQEAHQREHDRRVEIERQRDIDAERQYQQQIKQIRIQAIADDLAIRRMEIEAAQRENADASLNPHPTFAQLRSLNKALADADRDIENDRHKQAMKALDDQEAEARRQAVLHGQIYTEEAAYHHLRENENRRHQQKMGEIQARQKGADDDANPLKTAWDQLKQTTSINDFLSQSAADGLNKMTDAFGQAIEANILYGESIGKALKKALAEYLAHVSAESAIEALRQTAWGVAMLAEGNFASAALHFEDAALFGALALATGVAGSHLATSAGLKGAGASGSSAGQAIASTAPTPNNQNFLFNTSGTSSAADFRAGLGTSGAGLMNAQVLDRFERMHQQQMAMHAEVVNAVNRNTRALSTIETMDGNDFLTKNLNTPAGRRATTDSVLDHLGENSSAIRRLNVSLGFGRG